MKWMPGELDQRIKVVRETLADDGMGGHTATTATYATLWAKVIASAGNERLEAGAIAASASYKFVIRYRADILDSDYIEWGGVRYNIRALPIGGQRTMYLEIVAERGVA